jgi:large subunit ribosomal protein L25
MVPVRTPASEDALKEKRTMSEMTTIAAKKRDRAGKGGARAARRDGLIPAVIYGDKQPPLPISVEPKQLLRIMTSEGFLTHRMAIDVEGTKVEVLPRDVQVDPVTDRPVHFDFLRLGANSVITVDVPVHFRNEGAAPGIKRGGILNVIRHAITVRTRADQIPEFFEVDLTGLEIGHSVHLSALKLPEGVRVVSREKDATIASVAPPTVGREAEAEPTAAAAAATPAAGAAAPAAGAAAPAATPAAAAAPAAGAKAPAPTKK